MFASVFSSIVRDGTNKLQVFELAGYKGKSVDLAIISHWVNMKLIIDFNCGDEKTEVISYCEDYGIVEGISTVGTRTLMRGTGENKCGIISNAQKKP